MPVTHQPVVHPAELGRDATDPLGTEHPFDGHRATSPPRCHCPVLPAAGCCVL